VICIRAARRPRRNERIYNSRYKVTAPPTDTNAKISRKHEDKEITENGDFCAVRAEML
jgi:hypothetical protein